MGLLAILHLCMFDLDCSIAEGTPTGLCISCGQNGNARHILTLSFQEHPIPACQHELGRTQACRALHQPSLAACNPGQCACGSILTMYMPVTCCSIDQIVGEQKRLLIVLLSF